MFTLPFPEFMQMKDECPILSSSIILLTSSVHRWRGRSPLLSSPISSSLSFPHAFRSLPSWPVAQIPSLFTPIPLTPQPSLHPWNPGRCLQGCLHHREAVEFIDLQKEKERKKKLKSLHASGGLTRVDHPQIHHIMVCTHTFLLVGQEGKGRGVTSLRFYTLSPPTPLPGPPLPSLHTRMPQSSPTHHS